MITTDIACESVEWIKNPEVQNTAFALVVHPMAQPGLAGTKNRQ